MAHLHRRLLRVVRLHVSVDELWAAAVIILHVSLLDQSLIKRVVIRFATTISQQSGLEHVSKRLHLERFVVVARLDVQLLVRKSFLGAGAMHLEGLATTILFWRLFVFKVSVILILVFIVVKKILVGFSRRIRLALH